jgi:hypothetical protein
LLVPKPIAPGSGLVIEHFHSFSERCELQQWSRMLGIPSSLCNRNS